MSLRFASPRSLLGPVLALAAFACLVAAPAASADTASISFLDAAGHNDPVAGVGRAFVIRGNTPAPKELFVKYRAAGGAQCAPSYSADSGSDGFYDFSGDTFNYSDVNGDFTLRKTGVWGDPGTFTFCIWLAGSDDVPSTPIRQDITFRSPTGTISGTVSPVSPSVGQTATVTISGASESPKEVFAKIRRAGGAPCAVSWDADSGNSLVDWEDVDGSFSIQATTSEDSPGQYMLCMWLADSESDTAPVAGPQVAYFTVPAPCVVPRLHAGSTLADATGALAAAHCTLGEVRYAASTKRRRGTVVHLTPRGGHRLAPGSAVAVVLSTGKPCVVPRAPKGLKLRAAKRRLRANHCTVGSVKSVHSRRRAGTVVRFTARRGTVLPTRAKVGIRTSKGRH